jgi:quinol monooxygenase YgiN/mannose-6-phosphate isomerase-like protein (cupin superfamily)
MNAYTRFTTFRARRGAGAELIERLLLAARLIAEASGCEQWQVHRDEAELDAVRVSEIWASRAQCDAALQLDGIPEKAAAVMDLLNSPPEVLEGELVGGARLARGSAGASRFAILDAPDLSQDATLLSRYDLGDVVEARYVREQLDAAQVGLTHYRLPSNKSQGWAHRHTTAEEIYVALSGTGTIRVDDQPFDLAPLVAVRVAPASTRELQAGPDGLEVLVFGTHSPGDGQMVSHR